MGWVTGTSLAVTLLAWLVSRGQRAHLSLMGSVVLWGWLVQWLVAHTLGSEHRRVYPLYEFALLLFVAGLVVAEVGRLDFRVAAWWKWAVFCCILAQACLWIGYPVNGSFNERYPFLLGLNILGFGYLGVIVTASLQRRFMA